MQVDNAANIIEVNDLCNFIGGEWVHQHLNLMLNKQEILALVGGSGAGKTTLLRCILMLDQATSGSIKLFEQDIYQCSEGDRNHLRRRWGVLFQHSALFSGLTVIENIMFPLEKFTKLNDTERHEMALLKIALTGLPLTSAHKYPAELSGGMQKRVALARAIAMDPELLILDEPTAGLDPHSASAFDELLLNLRASLGLSILMVTHDIDSLWRVSDRVAFMGAGKILEALPLQNLIKADSAEIKLYFSGPRGRVRERAPA